MYFKCVYSLDGTALEHFTLGAPTRLDAKIAACITFKNMKVVPEDWGLYEISYEEYERG